MLRCRRRSHGRPTRCRRRSGWKKRSPGLPAGPGIPSWTNKGGLLGYCGVAELYGALAGRPAPEMRVGDIMRRDPPVLAEDRSMAEAAVLLRRREEVLVVTAADGSGKVIGVLTRLDLLRSLFTFIRRNNPTRSTMLSGSVAT
jgi:hypothetical protein